MGEDDRGDSLREFSDKLADARRRRDGAVPKPAPKEGLGAAMRIGVEMAAAVGVGAAVGWGLDRWFGTAPWLMVVFFALGSAAGAMNVYRYASGMDAAPGWRRRQRPQDGRED